VSAHLDIYRCRVCTSINVHLKRYVVLSPLNASGFSARQILHTTMLSRPHRAVVRHSHQLSFYESTLETTR